MDALPLVISGGWAAGVNAYATVLLLGIYGRLGLGDVPEGLESPGVMIAAAALFAVEFVTDKIPYVDNAWDAIHTAIRPTIAAALTLLAIGLSLVGLLWRRIRAGRARRRAGPTPARSAGS